MHGSREELINNMLDYDFDSPPPNPTTYRPIRESLAKVMSDWTGPPRTGGTHAR